MDTAALAALLLPLWLGPPALSDTPAAAQEAGVGLAAASPAPRAARTSPGDLQDPVLLRPARSGTFTIDNPGRRPMRVRLVPTAWSQTPMAEHLEPTDDLEFSHTVVDLAPGASLAIGVRSARPVGAVERAYQVLVEELGDGARPPRRIPVFVEPPVPRPASRIVDARLFYRTASFVLRNPGSAHVRAERITVVGLSTAGARVFTRTLAGGVLLAGGGRFHATDLPAESCRAATVEVQVETVQGPVVATLGRPTCT